MNTKRKKYGKAKVKGQGGAEERDRGREIKEKRGAERESERETLGKRGTQSYVQLAPFRILV